MEDLQAMIKKSAKEFDELSTRNGKTRLSEKWFLFLVGSLGRVRVLALGWGVVLLCAICLLSIFLGMFFWRYYQFEWVAAKKLEMEIQQKEIEALRKTNERLMARLATLEIYSGAKEEGRGAEVLPEFPGNPSESADVPLFPSVSIDEEKPAPVSEPVAADPRVTIEKYSAVMLGDSYAIAFTIQNRDPGTPVSGYIVAVLVPKDPQNLFLAAPVMSVVNGIPAEPKRGQWFTIRNLKDVRLNIATVNISRFRVCRLFVFNEDGTVMSVEDYKI